MNADFIMAVQELGKEKGIEPSILFEAVEEALVTAYKKNFGSNQNVRVDLNRTSGELHVYAQNILLKPLKTVLMKLLWKMHVKLTRAMSLTILWKSK